MSDKQTVCQQTLVALISECKDMGVDIDSLKERTLAGIKSNKEYVWLSNTTIKTETVAAIEKAFTQVAGKGGT